MHIGTIYGKKAVFFPKEATLKEINEAAAKEFPDVPVSDRIATIDHFDTGKCFTDDLVLAEKQKTTEIKTAEIHRHPLFPHRIVEGRRLNPGEIIQANDVYDSTSGRWENAPCSGIILQQGCETIWVRPTSKT